MTEQGAQIPPPQIRPGTTPTAALLTLGLLILAGGLIAALAIIEIRGDAARRAASRIAAIAESLDQSSAALAGVAPSLFAKGFDPAVRDQSAPQVRTQQQHVQQLIDELTAHLGTGEPVATLRASSVELFETIDRLSPAIASRAAAEAKLRQGLAAVATVFEEAAALSGQPRGAPIARWLDEARGASADIFSALAATDGAGMDGPAAAAGVVLSHAEEIADAAGGETAAGSRAAAPALPGLQTRLNDAVTGSDGVFAAQRQIRDLDGQIRQWLGRNAAAATRLTGAVDGLTETARVEDETAPDATRNWWLEALMLAGALGAMGGAIYVQLGVVRRLWAPESAPLSEPAAVVLPEPPPPPAEIIETIPEPKPAEETVPEAAMPEAAEDTAEAADEAKPLIGPPVSPSIAALS
jgi:hypothetical protein